MKIRTPFIPQKCGRYCAPVVFIKNNWWEQKISLPLHPLIPQGSSQAKCEADGQLAPLQSVEADINIVWIIYPKTTFRCSCRQSIFCCATRSSTISTRFAITSTLPEMNWKQSWRAADSAIPRSTNAFGERKRELGFEKWELGIENWELGIMITLVAQLPNQKALQNFPSTTFNWSNFQ